MNDALINRMTKALSAFDAVPQSTISSEMLELRSAAIALVGCAISDKADDESRARVYMPQYKIEAIFGLDKDGNTCQVVGFRDMERPPNDSMINLFEGLKMLEILKVTLLQAHGLLNAPNSFRA